jgi:predicted GIY-YIG superfamily endonuclease
MELLDVCLRTTYFQVDDRFYQQKDGMAMGSSLSPTVSNIYMKHFEKLALYSVQHKLSLWLQYVDDTYVIWPHGAYGLQNFLTHLNNLRSSTQFTKETELEGLFPFLDLLVTRKGIAICQERHDLLVEVNNLRRDLQLNVYPQGFINSVVRSKGSSRQKKEEKPLVSVYMPYVLGVSEKFKRIGNQYNIRTVFKTKHTLRSSLVRTRPNRDPKQTAHYVYSIPCECGRCYIGETGRSLAVRIREHRHNLKEGLLDKSKLTQHANEGHRVGWDEARILEIESNNRYRKYKESAHMACLTNRISQPSLVISPLWIPLISKEVSQSKGKCV